MLRKFQFYITLFFLFFSLQSIGCPLCSHDSTEKLCESCKSQLIDLIKTLRQGKDDTKKQTQCYKIPKDPTNPSYNFLLWESLLSGITGLASDLNRPYMSEASGYASPQFMAAGGGVSFMGTPHSPDGLDHQLSDNFFEALSGEEHSQIQLNIIPIIDLLCNNEELITTGLSWIATVNEAMGLLSEESHSIVISYECGLGLFFITYDFSNNNFLVLNWSDHYKYVNYSFRKINSKDDLKAYLKSILDGKNEIKSCFF